jgi:enterochelin esterase-like enzyme
MSRPPPARRFGALFVISALALGACTANGPPRPALTGVAGQNGAAGTSSPAAGADGSNEAGAGADPAGTNGGTGGAGVVATTGAAGALPAAAAAGGAGTDAATPADAISGLTTGTQADPGTDGDGMFTESAPYDLPPEALSHLNGAPTGQLLGPMVYTPTGTYTGWSTTWKFQYWIYVPAQYRPGHRAALIVFQDAIHYIGDPKMSDARFNTPTVLDNLINDKSVPVTIALFVNPGEPSGTYDGNEYPNRSKQYDTPNDQYGKFLVQELIPAVVTSKYDIVTDADGWAIGGHSSGGIAAFSASWYWNDNFHKVITASPSFSNTGGTFPAQILKVPAKTIRVYHLAGTNDLCCPSWYDENNQAAMDFMKQGYHYRYRPGTGMHFPPAAAAADFPGALRWLWRGYSTPP